MVAPTFGRESAYDAEQIEDEHGLLADQPIDPKEPLLQPVSAATFESAWRRARPWLAVPSEASGRYGNVEKKHVRYGERLSGQATTEADGGAAIATTDWGR